MPEALPIDAIIPDLLRVLSSSNRLVLSAAPGAGKTTRVPVALLNTAPRDGGRILVLEPRRIAARTAAERMATERGERIGETVGYRVRGESKTSKSTRIEVITEGILTRMLQNDPELPGIGALIFDEIHERSIHTDLGLALALEAQEALRPDLRIIAMSATLDTQSFSRLLGDCPVIECPGQSFPIETIWLDRPLQSNQSKHSGRRTDGLEAALSTLCLKALDETDGNVLVFLPGVAEIRRMATALTAHDLSANVEMLYGALPLTQQRQVLQADPDGSRRIILSTAIAETSLTVPGVRTVIDAGLSRRIQTDPATGMSRLATGSVTLAEADQRRGRAGRLGPGRCYRAWTRGQEGALQRYPEPEIRTSDITALVLELAIWGASDPSELSFLDQPIPTAFNAARTLLTSLGALDLDGKATTHGRRLAGMPVHPRLAHMLALADDSNLSTEAALISALLSARHGQVSSSIESGDLIIQLEHCLRDHSPGAKAIRAEAKRMRPKQVDPSRLTDSAGRLVASAYPDRIALRRTGEASRFLLSNGRGAMMRPDHPLSAKRLLAVTNIEDGREATIRTAVEIEEADLRALYPEQIKWVNRAIWSPRSRQVDARRQEVFGALVLRDEIWRDVPGETLGAALADGVRDLGLAALPWPKAATRLRARVDWLRRCDTDQDWPDLSDEALLDTIDLWLSPHLDGLRTIEDISRLNLTERLVGLMDWEQQRALDVMAPDLFTTPAGTRRPVDYSQQLPRVSVRLQEVYGTTRHPMLGRPAVPILFELLSPADRPVQSTSDLPAFWAGSYSEVRKDLRARYPKHYWPDHPGTERASVRSTRSTRARDTKS